MNKIKFIIITRKKNADLGPLYSNKFSLFFYYTHSLVLRGQGGNERRRSNMMIGKWRESRINVCSMEEKSNKFQKLTKNYYHQF